MSQPPGTPEGLRWVAQTPPPQSNNAYFDWRAAQPSCYVAKSLRTQAEIDACASGGADHEHAVYDPERDAMKLIIPNRIVTDGSHTGLQESLRPQIWIRFKRPDAGRHAIIWDWYPSSSMAYSNGFGEHKLWMVRRTGERIWFEPDADYLADDRVCHSGVRPYSPGGVFGPPPQTEAPRLGGFKVYSDDGDRIEQGTGLRYHQYNSNQIGPVSTNVYDRPGTGWQRRMILLHQRPDLGLCDCSFYTCSELSPVVRVVDRVQLALNPDERPVVFAYHLNASGLRFRDEPEKWPGADPGISWGRNVTVHWNDPNPEALLVQPVAD